MIVPPPSSKGYTIYTKSDCIFCTRVKELLQYDSPTIISCDSFLKDDKDEFLKKMLIYTVSSYKLFPMVFFNGDFIGGFSETKDYMKDNLLSYDDEF
jgi:glutaredoxin